MKRLITKNKDIITVSEPIMSYKEALKKANAINKELGLEAFHSKSKKRTRIVSWLHSDGSRFEVASACVRKISKNFIAIFTEHHGIFVYYTDDLEWVREHLRPISIYFNENII